MSTDLAAVLAGVQAALEADPAIGLAGSDAQHLRLVAPNVEWVVAQLPSAALLVRETQRTAQLDRRERCSATVEVRLALDGGDGRGDVPAISALVGGVRRVLIQNRLLASGSPLRALITGSQPTGETYEVIQPGERGWLQTAVLRWDATWLEPRVFDDVPVIDARHVRVITIVPGVGATEDQPPIAP